MKRIETAIDRQGISLREIGRRMEGRVNATRIREHLRQQKVPGPAVLGSLAAAVGISPIEAQWDAGRHEYVLHYLQSLYELGLWWMRNDRVALDRDAGALFYGHHRSRPGPNGIGIGKAPTVTPATLAGKYHGADLHNDVGVFRRVTLPKPMACAILLAIGLFPRRG